MDWLACQLGQLEGFELDTPNNKDYKWWEKVVNAGLDLANEVIAAVRGDDNVLLVGHSQGGLVCRVATIALVGKQHDGRCGQFAERIKKWQSRNGAPKKGSMKLGVVMIATPNAGALTFGQMSVAVEQIGEPIIWILDRLGGFHNLEDLTTPRLFEELQNWCVDARYLSISGVSVNRYSRGMVHNLAEILPAIRVSVRFDVPNDGVVEDSSTDLRQSLFRPEVDLANNYRHVRAYPGSISLGHFGVRRSGEVVKVIETNLKWLFAQGDPVRLPSGW